jgi:hypothetical protein
VFAPDLVKLTEAKRKRESMRHGNVITLGRRKAA